MGRPSDYSEELADRICAAIANTDDGLRRICAANDDFPDRTTIRRWLVQHEDFAAKYARAREGQADAIEEDMAAIEEKVATKKMRADAARVILWSKQWRAARLGRRIYGDRQQVDVNANVTMNLAGRMRARLSRQQAQREEEESAGDGR